MIQKSKVWGIRVLPQTKRKMRVLQKKSQVGSWDSFFEFIMDLSLETSENRDLLKLLTEKIKKSTRTSGLKTGECVPLFLFLEKDIYKEIEKDVNFLKGSSFESVIEGMAKDIDSWVKKTVPELSSQPSEDQPEKPVKESAKQPVKKLKKTGKGSTQVSDVTRWKDNPLIKIPTLEDVRIYLIEEKTIIETPEVRKRYRTYFCEVEKDDLLKPYWLELYIEKLEGAAKSENEKISKIDPEGFKFVKLGYKNYEKLEEAVGGVEELFGKLETGKLK